MSTVVAITDQFAVVSFQAYSDSVPNLRSAMLFAVKLMRISMLLFNWLISVPELSAAIREKDIPLFVKWLVGSATGTLLRLKVRGAL